MKRSLIGAVTLFALAASPPRNLAAQSDLGLPAIHQSNLLATARSPLYFQPWVPLHDKTRVTIALDYANIYELTYGYLGGEYIQDLEVGTVRLSATRDLSPATFVMADVPVSTAWAGGLDGFLGWWHDLLGIDMPARELRPKDEYAFQATFADGDSFSHPPSTYLGDIRVGAGWRFGPQGQLVATLTLPTTTAEGFGRGVVTAGVMLSGFSDLDPRLRVEGSVGLGYAPSSRSVLRPYQRNTFFSTGGGLRWRFYRQASMYGTLWFHSPYYRSTGFNSLDRNDLAFDFGFIFRTRSNAEWRFGMTEDPQPSGPGVDATFKVSRSW